jgi:hypothetical protein
MKVTLLVSEWCPTCPNAERVWREVYQEKAFELEVLDVGQPEGRKLVADKLIKTIPATLVAGELAKVGVPSAGEARELVADAPDREAGAEGAGRAAATLTMQRIPRHQVRAAAVYLVLGGLVLLGGGNLLGAGPGLFHLFAYGFVAFMIFGVAEHMLPRFTGHPVRTGWLQRLQVGLLHVGLWGFIGGRLADLVSVAGLGAGVMWLGVVAASARLLPLVWAPSSAERAENPAQSKAVT